VTLDPRWWRVTRGGTSPVAVASTLRRSRSVAVVTAGGRPIGVAALVEHDGGSATAVLELHAWPGAEALVRRVAPAIVRAAFVGGGLRRLYHRTFVDDPDVLGDAASWFTAEVRYPAFAWIDGAYRDRIEWCCPATAVPEEEPA
jgi:hypothetical protein